MIYERCNRCLRPFIGKPGICQSCAKEAGQKTAQPAAPPAHKPYKPLPLFDAARSAKGGAA